MARWLRIYGKKRGHRRTGSRQMGSAGEAVFCAILLLAGIVGVIWITLAWVVPDWEANHDYIEHECVVIAKSLEADSLDGEQYRPNITIQYQIDGTTYTSTTYDAARLFSRDRKLQQKRLADFEIGKPYPCWYSPQSPQNVVLVRQSGWWLWLVLLVPTSFMAIGGGGLGYTLWHWRISSERRAAISKRAVQNKLFDELKQESNDFPTVPNHTNLINSPGTTLKYRLPILSASTWRLFAVATFAVCWNTIVTVFLVIAIGQISANEPGWWLNVFLIPFLIFGVYLVYYLFWQVKLTTGIGPTLVEISEHPLTPGDNYDLLISQTGNLNIKRLQVVLECEEEAAYHQGTDVRRESYCVREIPLFSQLNIKIDQQQSFQQQTRLHIPNDAMHSLALGYNEIRWSIAVHLETDQQPKLCRKFPIIVCPKYLVGSRP